VVALVAAAATIGSGGVDGQIPAIADHLERHPLATAVDLYKFIHQGVFGPGHMVSDRSAAAAYLSRELAGLGPAEGTEPLCEELGGEPPFVRVHLRPWLESGHELEQLLEAFVDSASRIEGNPAEMARAIDSAVAWLDQQGRVELAAGLRELASEHQADGFPALRHSDQYREAYHPAYRVVLRELAETHGWCEPGSPS
jgi:hypothetical protein